MARTAQFTQAQALARAKAKVGKTNRVGYCLAECVAVYGIPGPYGWGGNGRAWAYNYWLNAVAHGKVVKTSDPMAIPAGALLFHAPRPGATTVGGKAGHVAISAGGGYEYSTDQPRDGKWGKVTIASVERAWGKKLVGYIIVTGDGVRLMPDPVVARPPAAVVRWHGNAFLNTHGDDGATGTRTFTNRTPQMVADLTHGSPEVVGACEIRVAQEPGFTTAMRRKGYDLVAYSHRLALYRLKGSTKAGSSSFYEYPTQNKGATEGILRARILVNGSWSFYGVTHLDYRDGFDAGRVEQITEGTEAMASFGERWAPGDWQKRTTILGDFNSKSWVTAALKRLGYNDAGAGASIDFITVGKGRTVMSASKASTTSDHPVVRATLGRAA